MGGSRTMARKHVTFALLVRPYLFVTAACLFFAAYSKWTSHIAPEELRLVDPFLSFLSEGQLLNLVSIFEVIVAGSVVYFAWHRPIHGVVTSLWLSSIFVLYRLGFLLAPERYGQSCRCLGGGGGLLGGHSDAIAALMLAFFLAGGAVALCACIWAGRSATTLPLQPPQASSGNTLIKMRSLAAFGTIYIFGVYRGIASTEFEALYSARGKLQYTVRTNDVPILEQEFKFSFLEGVGGQWRLDLSTTTPDQNRINSTEILSFDLTNIYSITYSDARLETHLGSQPRVITGNSSYPARVCAGPFPIDHGPTAGLIWLAFVGGRYVDPTKKSQALPNLLVLPDARHDPMAWACSLDHVELSGGTRPLLLSGQFRLDTNYLHGDSLQFGALDEPETEQDLQRFNSQIALYRSTSRARLVRASYRVERTSHLGSIDIPEKFSADVASPLVIPDAYSGMTTISIDGVVTDIVEHPSIELLPPLKGQVTVQDRRVRVKNARSWRREVYYPLTNLNWVTDTNYGAEQN